MKIDTYITVSTGLWNSEEMLVDRAHTLHFISEFDLGTNMSTIFDYIESDYGELECWGNFYNKSSGEVGFFVERENRIIFNPNLKEITLEEYINDYCEDKVRLVFFKERPAIGGDGPAIIDWVATMVNFVDKSMKENPLFWALLIPTAKMCLDAITHWVEYKIQERSVTPELLLKAIYSRTIWDINDFNEYFEVHNINASKELLISFGYKKKNNVYKLVTKHQPKDIKVFYVGDYTLEVSEINNDEQGLG